ncbi:AraC family transcriptional regulator [Clostridiaceae bacterium M8S5]|nr:AraC family transcriptional regulator [Clostridiaceae bacterium M8S5]
MDYSLTIWTISTYIEARVRSEIKYEEMERKTGFSYRHIREVFKECTGVSLSKYINERRLSNAAFDIANTEKN